MPLTRLSVLVWFVVLCYLLPVKTTLVGAIMRGSEPKTLPAFGRIPSS